MSIIQILGRVISKLIEIQFFYYTAGHLTNHKKSEGRFINKEELIDFFRTYNIYPEHMIQEYNRNFESTDKRPFAILHENKITSLGWVGKASNHETPSSIRQEFKKHICISDCVTALPFRGNGLYPELINQIISKYDKNTMVLISTHFWNTQSRRGIEKSDMKIIITRIKFLNLHFWLNK